jgi:hypothetical protein
MVRQFHSRVYQVSLAPEERNPSLGIFDPFSLRFGKRFFKLNKANFGGFLPENQTQSSLFSMPGSITV